MNWKEIEKRYPKAFELADEKINNDWTETDRIGIAWDIFHEIRGHLHDFFDEQELFIKISPNLKYEGDGKLFFWWKITEIINKVSKYECGGTALTRISAESRAFANAFAILEKKL